MKVESPLAIVVEPRTQISDQLLLNIQYHHTFVLDILSNRGQIPIIAAFPFGSALAGTAVGNSDYDLCVIYDTERHPQARTLQLPGIDRTLDFLPLSYSLLEEYSLGKTSLKEEIDKMCFGLFLLGNNFVLDREDIQKMYDKQRTLVANLVRNPYGEKLWQEITEILDRRIVQYQGEKSDRLILENLPDRRSLRTLATFQELTERFIT